MINIFKSRKAQITIFIIIGIILLFSSALIMYIKNRVTETTKPPTVIQSTPEELTGMKKYIENCIYLTGKDAVRLIGAHGGYIYPEKFDIRTNAINPTEGSGIEMFAGSGYIVPYWYYLSSPNTCVKNCEFNAKIPILRGQSAETIESQISDYINKNLRKCLNNFGVYRQMGYEINEKGQISTKTSVTKEEVILDVTWPIQAGRQDEKLKNIEKFVVTLPINLKQIYEFAQLIIKKQSENNYLEANTLNLITYHSDRTKKQLPPMADYSFMPQDTQSWILKDVEKELKTVLFLYTPLLRIKDTPNSIDFPYPTVMVQTVMNKMIINLNDNDTIHPLNVDFRYSEKWPIYLDITPKNGERLTPKDILGNFGVLGMLGVDMKQYEFQYDISYPVVIKIDDPKAYDYEGYSFMFAIETNIRNNKPLNASFDPLEVSSAERSFVCDEGQKKSGNITVNTVDALTKKPLEGVSVTFSFSKEGCQMGLTAKEVNTSNKASLIERYPQGIGSLTFSKMDYSSVSMLYATKEGKIDEINVSLYPLIEKEVDLRVYHVDKKCLPLAWEFNSTIQNISVNESVVITLNKVKTFESPDNLNEAASYNGSIINDTEKRIMKLSPGRYEIIMMSTLNENLTLPRQTVKFGSKKKTFTQVFEEMQIQSPYNEGIMQFNNETYYFDIHPEDLYTNSSVRFYALVYDLKSVPLSCRTQYPSDLMPEPGVNKIMISKKSLLMPRFINKG